ncbi:hypothetical protein X922_00770 [Pseudomonas aeruginosa VRFPA08]|nr:hypothetical protein X922_00770 [Pseudomonas aeruginosa VRFPA08]
MANCAWAAFSELCALRTEASAWSYSLWLV